MSICLLPRLFFFNDTATTEIYTLSLHDALPIYGAVLEDLLRAVRLRLQHEPAGHPRDAHADGPWLRRFRQLDGHRPDRLRGEDRKSTRLNSSHANISYAVFCLKKKKTHY